MKYYFSLICILSYFGTIAQGTITVKNGSISSSSNYSNMDSYYNVKDGDVIVLNGETVGTPYLFDEFKMGSIYFNDDEIISSVALKYNAYNDVFLAKPSLSSPDSEAQGVSKKNNLKIRLENQFFLALPNTENSYELQYYEVLSNGKKAILLKKTDKIYKERVAATTSLTRDIPAAFKDKISYYLVDSKGDFHEISTSKKKLLALFGDKKKQMTECVKKNNLNVKKEEDLIRLFRFYETL